MENQKIEFKENWRDEYLKIIAGFANAEGGELLLGVSDNGEILGIDDYQKLLEELPNKIKNKLLITPSILLEEHNDKKINSLKN